MIITENREKVKRKVKELVNKLKKELTKPERKFVMEMILGMILSGSCNITDISRKLREDIKIKDTSKRLLRMLSHEHILEIANKLSLKESKKFIKEDTIIAIDGGDITHEYGNGFEKSSKVRDGSKGEYKDGYYLNQISGYNEEEGETFPIMLEIYSILEEGFKSINTNSLLMIERVKEVIGKQGLWVMDRGYDSRRYIGYFLREGLDFMLRMVGNRDIKHGVKKVNLRELSEGINRRIKYGKHSRFGSKKVHIEIGLKEYKITVISYKDKRNKDSIIWITNGWIKSSKELKRRIRGYFRRWGIEELYRFEKQGFGIERATVRRYSKIKTLIGLTVLSWMLLLKIRDNKRLKEEILKEAKMEKEKLKDRPKFIYYRLLRGIRNMFSGIRELFRFRKKRRYKEEILRKIEKSGKLPFNQYYSDILGFEV